jgi:hypothetical protein
MVDIVRLCVWLFPFHLIPGLSIFCIIRSFFLGFKDNIQAPSTVNPSLWRQSQLVSQTKIQIFLRAPRLDQLFQSSDLFPPASKSSFTIMQLKRDSGGDISVIGAVLTDGLDFDLEHSQIEFCVMFRL